MQMCSEVPSVVEKWSSQMAKGMKCRICGEHMYAQREDDQPKGRWVYYVCRATACTNTEKVFENYP